MGGLMEHKVVGGPNIFYYLKDDLTDLHKFTKRENLKNFHDMIFMTILIT